MKTFEKTMSILGYILAVSFTLLYSAIFGSIFILLIAEKPLYCLGLAIFGFMTYTIIQSLIGLIDDILSKYNDK